MKNPDAIQIIKNHLDEMYKNANEITIDFNSQYIPLNLLWELVERSKFKKNKELGDFPEKFNNMMKTLYKASMSYCEKHELNKKLPMPVLKLYIEQLKNNL